MKKYEIGVDIAEGESYSVPALWAILAYNRYRHRRNERMTRWEFSNDETNKAYDYAYGKKEEEKMDRERSIFARPKARVIRIEETITGGFIVDVGCKHFAFGPSPEEISRLSDHIRRYLLNPREVERMSYEAAGEASPETVTHEEATLERVDNEKGPEEDENI